MKKKRMPQNQLSDLPDHILHKIISSLSTKDAAKISTVSRKFRSARNTFPIIDLDYKFFHRSTKENRLKDLINTAESSLNHLRESRICLDKFKLNNLSKPIGRNGVGGDLREVINSAIENKVGELDINFNVYDLSSLDDLKKSCFHYQFLVDQLDIKSIRVLKLGGIELPNSILNFPSLEILHLLNCLGPIELTISSTRLNSVKLENYYGSSEVKIEANDLEEFSFNQELFTQAPLELESLGSICLSEYKSIKTLDLSTNLASEEWLSENLPGFLRLEVLRLRKCNSLRNLCISNSCLKELVLENCNVLEKVKIVAESLESFVFRMGRILSSEIELTGAMFLKNLEIYNGSITDEWIERVTADSGFLESVILSECDSLRELKICNEMLRDLKLLDCRSLKEAELFTRNLCSLSYRNHELILPCHFVIDSANVEAIVELKRKYNVIKKEWYAALRDFLVCFGHCKLLTLVCHSSEVLIFPKQMRENTLAPLFDLKHVKVNTSSKFELKLVDSLLWCCPQPHSLSINASPCFGSELEEKIIKLVYDKKRETRGGGHCCHHAAVKCWKHYLKEVNMINFNNKEYKIMKQFFDTNVEKGEKSSCIHIWSSKSGSSHLHGH